MDAKASVCEVEIDLTRIKITRWTSAAFFQLGYDMSQTEGDRIFDRDGKVLLELECESL